VADARPTLADLSRTISSSGPDNDLIDLLHKTPKLGRQAQVVFPRAVRTLRRAQPVLEFIRPYAPELVGWFRDFGEGASTYDANGHYARIQPIFNTFSVNDQLSALQPLLEGNRLKGLSAGNTNRCPGTATQRRPDGSNPWRDSGGKLDCNPSEVPPGP
jgi:phospholipid/cholesterol/gamma-HCH transport system substrate-binding protein